MSETSATLNKRARTPVFVLLLVLALTIAYPVVLMALSSLRTKADYLKNPFGLPGAITFDNFVNLINNYGIGRAAMNSLFVVTTGVALVLVLATLAAYALAKLPVPGAKYINASFVSVMLIPSQVLIIPIYLMLSKLHLVGEFGGIILVYVATGLPFAVFFLTLSFKAIPDQVLEAARLDGAGFLRTMWSIVVPIGGAGIATLAVLQFLAMWNELIFAYVLLPDDTKMLLTPALTQIGTRFVSDQPLMAAGLLVTALPPTLLLAFTSKYVMKGMAVGVGR
ncbi:ABC transporter permease subunit [Leifsonia naganoensis]|uniref:ABC-type glycerol-3-phosphate transport system permease component n=1 Tax=Leifsonia naganoensis TaxID=150025 RepID=A0A853DR68_9MICO|nr:ABC-type glycerol-3-phosphate transport system permease component [Leifsonia naganoensis]